MDDLIRYAFEAIKAQGEEITPTKGACKELIGVSFDLLNPRARLSRSVSRGRIISALGEFCWYMSGSDLTSDITYFVREYAKFDESGVIPGAYGPRLIRWDDSNQVARVIENLQKRPATRKAVIQLFDHSDLDADHADVPCTCVLQYFVRQGRLESVTYMRSNDLFWGLPHDFFCFTMLQEFIARSIGADLGSYHHHVGSLHVYKDKFGSLEEFIDEGWQSTLSMPAMPEGDPTGGLRSLLNVANALRSGGDPLLVDYGPTPYWADLGRLLGTYTASRSRSGPAIEELRRRMTSDYYGVYIQSRLDNLAES